MTKDLAPRGPADYGGGMNDEEYDESSSARLFERSRIKALAGKHIYFFVSFSLISLAASLLDWKRHLKAQPTNSKTINK